MKDVIDIETPTQALVVRERASIVLTPVKNVATAKADMAEFQQFISEYLELSEDGGASGDYGIIAGTKKKTLLKSGADKLCEIYGLYDTYDIRETIDWKINLFDYEITCTLRSRRDDSVVGSGIGCCSSFESRYRFRDEQRKCPNCDNTTIIKGKEEFGGGWLCWAKKGGCGTKFKDGDPQIESQTIGRVENPDIVDLKNTVFKMAKKRAKIDAVIGVTRSSGILTQDLEDIAPIVEVRKVPVTEKEIPLPQRSSAAPAEHTDFSHTGKDEKKPTSQAADEFITTDQAARLHMHFRDFLDPSLRRKSDSYLEGWCKSKGLVDSGGAGTTKAIKKTYKNGKDGFESARQALEQYALELNIDMSEEK